MPIFLVPNLESEADLGLAVGNFKMPKVWKGNLVRERCIRKLFSIIYLALED